MLCVNVSVMGDDVSADDDDYTHMVPMGGDYGYILTIDDIKMTYEGQGITGVTYYEGSPSSKQQHKLYGSPVFENLLYTTVNNSTTIRTDGANPNYNQYLRFDQKTGLGPFNSYYVALNIGDTQSNGDEYKTSSGNGEIAYILNPYNLKEAIISKDGGVRQPYADNATEVEYYEIGHLTNYNIMLMIPTVYWHSDGNTSGTSHLWLSNRPDYFSDDSWDTLKVSKDKMVAYAHTVGGQVRSFLALGVYESTMTKVNNKDTLISQSDKTPLKNKSISEFRQLANSLNDLGDFSGEYMIWNYYQWTLYKMMSYTVIGTKNSQLAIGQGATLLGSGGTGMVTGKGDDQSPYWGGFNTDSKGSYTNGKNSSKLFLENTWGSYHDLVDDVWIGNGQMHVGQNDIQTLISHTLQPASGTTDAGLNDNQAISSAKFTDQADREWMKYIIKTSNDPETWDFPIEFKSGRYTPNGDAVQYRPGYQTLCVGGHYDAQDKGGLNRMNIRNGFGEGKYDIGTRLAYVTEGGTINFVPSEKYTVITAFREVVPGASLLKGVEVEVVPVGDYKITYITVNTEKQLGNTFTVGEVDIDLRIVVDNEMPVPPTTSYAGNPNEQVIAKFTYDGQEHFGVPNIPWSERS